MGKDGREEKEERGRKWREREKKMKREREDERLVTCQFKGKEGNELKFKFRRTGSERDR